MVVLKCCEVAMKVPSMNRPEMTIGCGTQPTKQGVGMHHRLNSFRLHVWAGRVDRGRGTYYRCVRIPCSVVPVRTGPAKDNEPQMNESAYLPTNLSSSSANALLILDLPNRADLT